MPDRAPRWQLAALAVLGALYVAHATRYGVWMIDDAGITFAYAQNIAAGNGPVVNVGQPPVEGYSNPSWTFLLAALSAVHLFSVPMTPKLVAGALNLAAMFLAWRASRRAWGEPASAAHLLAPTLMAFVPSFVKYTMSGLENSLYVFAIVAAWEAQLRERDKPGWSGGLLTFLTVLGRPEGIAYAAVLGLDRLVTAARTRSTAGLWRWTAGFVGPWVLYLTWHAVTFEDWLPNTYYAKIRDERSLSELFAEHGRTRKYVDTFFSDHLLYWAPAVAALALAAPKRWLSASGLALFGAVGVAFSFPVYAGGDWMPQHRLFSPLYPLLGLAAAGGFTTPLFARFPAVLRGALPVAAIGLTGVTVPAALERATSTLGMRLEVQMTVLDAYSRWADFLGLDHVVVGLADVGGASMTTTPRFELVDVNGLIDRRIAHLRRGLLTDGAGPVQAYIFQEKRPDFLNYPEAVYRLYDLADYPAAREDWWVMNNVDPAGRFGTFVRRDLVEGQVPADLTPVRVADGLLAAARVEGGELHTWWVVDGPQTTAPAVTRMLLDAAGQPVKKETIKPMNALGARLLQPGRVLHEKTAAPPNVASVSWTERGASPAPSAAATDVDLVVPTAPLPSGPTALVPDGDFEGENTAWTSIPASAPGWSFESEGGSKAVRIELAAKGPLVCGGWSPMPPVLRVSGRARGEDIVRGDKPWKAAGVTLRVKKADKTQVFPILKSFEGTFGWTPFQAEYVAAEGENEYRLCVGGTGGTGRLWADDLAIGG